MSLPASRPSERRAGLLVLGAFGFLTVLFTGLFTPFSSPNELSRLEMVFAVVENGTFRIDQAIGVLGQQEDKAFSGGHLYSNKAPGLSLAAIPVYRFLRLFLPQPRTASDAIFVCLRILVVSSLCTLALMRFHTRLSARHGPVGLLVTAAVGFGTPYLFYARSFLSHAWTAALLYLAWDLWKHGEDLAPGRRVGRWFVGAGLLAGWAAISEYPAALVLALFAVRALRGRIPGRAVFLGLGAAVPIAVLAAYNAICFGSPFVLSSAREALPRYAELSERGLFGFGAANAQVAMGYLVHPARGILLFSPFFLWTFAGFRQWWRKREDRADCLFFSVATALFFFVMTGYPNWHGGWSLGSRYLMPVLFPAAFAIGQALESPVSRSLFAAAMVFSVLTHVLLTVTWPYFPLNVPWPPATASLWFLKRGWIAPNLFGAAGARGLALPVAGAAVLVALATALAVAGLARRRRWSAWLLGGGALAVTLLFPPQISFGGRLWRAAVFGKYSGLDPKREELRRVMQAAATPSEQQRAADAWRLFGPE
ncbi:MAG TPA: hypothetical protein VLO07_05440 [Thermoanaerobaculia bacterium]|nr:hypothetical protein [Thermoanaerobaculia bacterium]